MFKTFIRPTARLSQIQKQICGTNLNITKRGLSTTSSTMAVRQISFPLAFLGIVLGGLWLNNTLQSSESITNWANKDGEFKRQNSQFRNAISKESGAEFPPEKDRYHLYVSYACPWGRLNTSYSHRAQALTRISPPCLDRTETQRPRRHHPLHQRTLAHARKG